MKIGAFRKPIHAAWHTRSILRLRGFFGSTRGGKRVRERAGGELSGSVVTVHSSLSVIRKEPQTLAIKIKVLEPPKLNILEKMYIPEILRGLMITLKHMLFVRSITIQYPEEVKELPPRYRGLHVLPADDEGEIRCVACKLCEVACPTQAISIVAEAAATGAIERRPKVYNIDFMRCVFCSFCVEACPCDALRMGMEYELASYNRAGLVHTKEVFFDPNVKSLAPRDNANFLYASRMGDILDTPEDLEKVRVMPSGPAQD